MNFSLLSLFSRPFLRFRSCFRGCSLVLPPHWYTLVEVLLRGVVFRSDFLLGVFAMPVLIPALFSISILCPETESNVSLLDTSREGCREVSNTDTFQLSPFFPK